MMISMDEARARVARGARHLDYTQPGWHTRIDISTLELKCEEHCILGQLHGDFWEATAAQFPRADEDADWTIQDVAVQYGFVLVAVTDVSEVNDYRPLQDAWVEAIAARQCRSEQPVVRVQVAV